MILFLVTTLAWADCPADANDVFEPNNSQMDATKLTFGTHSDLGICDGNPDYFNVYPTSGATLSVTVQYDETLGTLRLALMSVTGQILTESTGINGVAEIESEMAIGGGHILVVEWMAGVSTGFTYSLSMSETEVSDCLDDGFEPNQSPAQTAVLVPGQHDDLMVCVGDADWYSISLASAEFITVDVAFAHADGDIDISLIDPNGQPAESSMTMTDNESLSFLPLMSGDYILNVQVVNESDSDFGVPYSIEIETTQMAVCMDDSFEENDSQSTPAEIQVGEYGELSACDDDWYSVALSAGETVTIELSFDHTQGDIDLSFYDVDGVWLDSASSSGDSETLSYDVEQSGYYSFNVRLFSDDDTLGNTYSMILSVENDFNEPSTEPSSEPAEPGLEPTDDGAKAAGCQTMNSNQLGLYGWPLPC